MTLPVTTQACMYREESEKEVEDVQSEKGAAKCAGILFKFRWPAQYVDGQLTGSR